jgi:hypothetical protein
MMLFSPPMVSLSPSPDQFSIGPAIRCLLSYSEDLGDCWIDVEVIERAVLLTGYASSDSAVARAIEIVTGFTSRRVVCRILVSNSTSS